MVSLTLLERRAWTLLQGLAAGYKSGGESPEVAFQLVRAIAKNGRVEAPTQAAIRGSKSVVSADNGALPSDRGVEEPALIAGIGMIHRPQNHYGIIDDVINFVAPRRHTSEAIAASSAVAAAYAALLDGWHMEGAAALAIFTCQRAATFGKKFGEPAISQRIQEALEIVEDEEASGKAVQVLGARFRSNRAYDVVPLSLGLSVVCRDAKRAIDEALSLSEGEAITAAIVGALCGAYAPDSVPRVQHDEIDRDAWEDGATDKGDGTDITGHQFPSKEHVDRLLQIRMSW